MRVYIFVASRSASLNARALPLANFLRSFGVKCYLVIPADYRRFLKGKLGKIFSGILTYNLKDSLSVLSHHPDIVIIGKTSNFYAYLLMRIFKRKKIRVVFDLNDAIFLPVGSVLGLSIRPASFHLESIMKNVDYVTVNGHYLLNYANKFNKNTAIIHDPIDTQLFHPRNKVKIDDKVVITWEGTAPKHRKDLAIIVKPLIRIAKEYGNKIKFKIVSYLGDYEIKNMFSPLERIIEVDYGSERWLPLKKFAKMLWDADIMVAPLQRTLWNEGKSALRVGIGMALGIPVIASPVGEQKYIIKHGINGFLARDEEEWYKYLKLLIEDEKLRNIIGKMGRKTAEKQLSLRACGKKLFDILNRLLR